MSIGVVKSSVYRIMVRNNGQFQVGDYIHGDYIMIAGVLSRSLSAANYYLHFRARSLCVRSKPPR